MVRLPFAILAAGAALSTALALGGALPARADAPRVVASIVPIHALVAGVMDGVATPTLLVKGGASPHAYALKPSDAEALQEADVVFWVGDELETFLDKPLRAIPRDARIVALHEAAGVTLLPYRVGGPGGEHPHDQAAEGHAHEGDAHDAHGHDHAEHHESHDGPDHAHDDAHDDGPHDGHAHGETDMHIWLDPVNAQAMVDRIAQVLSDADADNAARYQANATALRARLGELDAALRQDLDPVKARAFVVLHDAYQYFEKRYGLSAAGSITVSPERRPSAQALVEVRARIAETGAACVFAEPQFEPAIIATVVEGTGARTGVLDPLGAALTPGPDAYFELLQGLAESLTTCLGQQG
jgi:zinc transport system substrate-binding protein